MKFVLINFDKKWKFGVSTLESNLRVFHWFHWADIGVILSEIKWIFIILLKNILKFKINGWKLQFTEKLPNFESYQKSEKMQKVSDLKPNTYFWLQIQNQHEILYQKIPSFAFRPAKTSLLPLLAGVGIKLVLFGIFSSPKKSKGVDPNRVFLFKLYIA